MGWTLEADGSLQLTGAVSSWQLAKLDLSPIVNNVAKNIGVQISAWVLAFTSFDIYSEKTLKDIMIVLGLILGEPPSGFLQWLCHFTKFMLFYNTKFLVIFI